MGGSSRNGGVIVFVPGRRRGDTETLGAGRARRGETMAETIERVTGGDVPANARVYTLSGDQVRDVSGLGLNSDFDIEEIMDTPAARRIIMRESRAVGDIGGDERLADAETRAAGRARRAAENVAALRRQRRNLQARRTRLLNGGASNRSRNVQQITREIRDLDARIGG